MTSLVSSGSGVKRWTIDVHITKITFRKFIIPTIAKIVDNKQKLDIINPSVVVALGRYISIRT